MDRILSAMPDSDLMAVIAQFFKLFGDPNRLRIIYLLMHQELCVADLAALIGMQQPAVSQQLKILRLCRLVKHRKDGKTIWYSLDDRHVSSIFRLALLHLQER